MDETICDIIRRHSHPLQPRPTGQAPVLHELEGIRAVLFDIYGTLFISGSGDVGINSRHHQEDAFADALWAMAIEHRVVPPIGDERLRRMIRQEHSKMKDRGIEWPEVDIVSIWRDTLTSLATDDLLSLPSDFPEDLLQQLATEYEVRINPVWPMPGARECLAALRTAEIRLGVISNAQFFTRELFPVLLDGELSEIGFEKTFQFFSYEHRQAKPGLCLYELARRALEEEGMGPVEVLYVGNDMLNDIATAARIGFQTALFAGDLRSLRLREGEKRVIGIRPNLVLTELFHLPDCVARP